MVKTLQKSSSLEPAGLFSRPILWQGQIWFGFAIGKVKTVDFSETIAASDLKVGRSRHLIEYMKVCEY